MSRESLTSGLIVAARIVLREIAEILEAYPKAVIAGGTVPYLLIPQEPEPHEGTIDIDIVLDLAQPGADPNLSLHEILERHLYQQDPKRPFRYRKGLTVNDELHFVIIELLGGGPPPPSGMRRIHTEDVYVSIIRGMEVALDRPVEIQLPDEPDQRVSVASLPAFFAMKAVALASREELKKPKDAYDIVYCLRNYEGGVEAIASQYRDVLANPLIASGLSLMASLFESVDAPGPVAYSRGSTDKEDASLQAREAFERVQELLRALLI